jgi:hypothetical protein
MNLRAMSPSSRRSRFLQNTVASHTASSIASVVEHRFRHFKSRTQPLQAGGDGSAQIVQCPRDKRHRGLPDEAGALPRAQPLSPCREPALLATSRQKASPRTRQGERTGARVHPKVSRSARSAVRGRREDQRRDGASCSVLLRAQGTCEAVPSADRRHRGVSRVADRPDLGLGAYRALTYLPINSLHH